MLILHLAMRVLIYSRYRVIAESLALLVRACGFESCMEQGSQVDAALYDLIDDLPPYPPPPSCPTLALISNEKVFAISLLKQGYRGYLGSGDDGEVLKRALEAVQHVEMWATRTALTEVFDSLTGVHQITPRETDVLSLLGKGLSNRAIAKQLGITERTVKAHVSRLLQKYGARSRSELLVQLYRRPRASAAD